MVERGFRFRGLISRGRGWLRCVVGTFGKSG